MNTMTNCCPETGIRYGIIPINRLVPWVHDCIEPDYGSPTCPKCGSPLEDHDIDQGHDLDQYQQYRSHQVNEYACEHCGVLFESQDAFPEEPCSWILTDPDDPALDAFVDDYGDVWVVGSSCYTHADFCSPCAPGACYLANPNPQGAKAFCLPAIWFDGIPPYPIYSIANHSHE